MNHPGWLLIAIGALLLLVGAVWLLVPHVPWLGRLPGDIRVEGEGGGFYFPITTCLLLSGVLTLILWVIRSLWR